METGFIKIHRKLLAWEWYSDHNTKALFLHFLLTANYKPTRYQGHVIPAGALVFGRRKAAETLGISEQSIRTSLNRLKSTSEITIKTNNKFSIIQIVKWGDYQCSTSKLTNDQPATNQQLTTSKEVKKERSKEEDSFDVFWEQFPRQRRGNKEKAFAAYKKAIGRDTHENILAGVMSYSASDEVARGFAKGAAAWLNDDRWTTNYKGNENEGTRKNREGYSERLRRAALETITGGT